MKKIIFGIVIGIILCSGIVYATSYLASDISYSNNEATAKNVNEALDDLYNMKQELNDLKSIGTADASDITEGETALVKGVEVIGTKKDISPITIPSILHNRNGEKGNNYIATTKVTLNVKDYTTLTIGSVTSDGTYSFSVKSNTGVSLKKSGTSDITNYETITFTIGEVYNATHSTGDVGFYNIVIS